MKAHINEKSATYQILDQYRKTILEVTHIDIQTKGRRRDQADLIKIFCKHSRDNLKLSSGRIGKFLNRDHATVLHACRTYNNLYLGDKKFREKAEFFITRFENIDGKSRQKPNMDQLIELAKCASESTIADWLKLIRSTELIKESFVDYEIVDNE